MGQKSCGIIARCAPPVFELCNMEILENLDNRSEKRLRKIFGRCQVLAQSVLRMQPVYKSDSISPDQRNYLETVIGAGLWYIPNKGFWTGRISIRAIKNHHPDGGLEKPHLTADHQYPRKVAAAELLSQSWNDQASATTAVIKSFITKYGRYNLRHEKRKQDTGTLSEGCPI